MLAIQLGCGLLNLRGKALSAHLASQGGTERTDDTGTRRLSRGPVR
jgi:hypothetical protein